ncbi:carboxymuconolactone decarboxylase family protein [Nocardiopsis coralliicola]
MDAERLPRLAPEELDASQRALRAAITGGPRAAGPRHFALEGPDGALNGPFGLMLHAPELGAPLQELGAAIRYRTGLSARAREIAILTVAAAADSAFERHAHERVGAAAGLTGGELSALRSAAFTSPDPVEQAVHTACRALMADPGPWDSGRYAAVEGALGAGTLLELTVLVGYYRTLAQMMNVFGVGAPGAEHGAGGEGAAGG